jgi:uncharacterized protein (TIGR00156 family)
MNLSRKKLFDTKIMLSIAIMTILIILIGCSPNKNNTEFRDKEPQFLPYSSQLNESNEYDKSENKMVPAVMTGDGKLHRLDNFRGRIFYAFKVDVEEGYFSENIVVPMSVTTVKKIHSSNIPVLLQGKIIDFLRENIFIGEKIYLFEDNTGTIVIKLNRDLYQNLPVERSKMIEITGEIILKYPENEIQVEAIREYILLKNNASNDDTINFLRNRA